MTIQRATVRHWTVRFRIAQYDHSAHAVDVVVVVRDAPQGVQRDPILDDRCALATRNDPDVLRPDDAHLTAGDAGDDEMVEELVYRLLTVEYSRKHLTADSMPPRLPVQMATVRRVSVPDGSEGVRLELDD